MMDQKGSYLNERIYFTDARGKESGKTEYWEGILGKDRLSQLAKENEKIRLHLQQAPYSVLEKRKLWIETSGKKYGREKFTDIFKGEEPLFAPFYQDILQEGLSRFRHKRITGTIPCSEQIEKDFLRYTMDCLQKVSLRVLILEMRQIKEGDGLCGKDEREEYQDFLRRYLGDESYIRGLYERYPALFRILEDQTEQCVDYFCEIIEHLETDREAIETQLLGGKSVTMLGSIRCKQGDVHHHGKSVASVNLNGTEEVLYKPHSLDNECIFQDLLKRVSETYGLWNENMGLKIVSRPDYGWEEKIYFQECEAKGGVNRFYERAGMQLFLTSLLRTVDLHCENMIARGEYPVLIDLETLIHLTEQDTKQDEVSCSVLRSGILPAYLSDGKGIGQDVSALSGEGGRESQMMIPVIKNAYTSRMRIEYRHGVMGQTQNRVTYKGKPAQTAEYMEDLLRGFRNAYECVMDSKELQSIILNLAEASESRYVVSDTMKYASLLNSSYHPDLLADGGDRELFLHSVGLVGKTRRKRLAQCETEAMLRGDIPYFYSKGRNLMCEDQVCAPDYFKHTPRQAVQNKMAKLSRRDEQFQVKLIELSIAISEKIGQSMINSGRKRKDIQEDAMSGEHSDITILSICEKIAGLILENVYEDEDGKLQILSMDMLEQSRSKIRRVSQYFYEGIAGIALFLYALETEKVRMNKMAPDKKGNTRTVKKVSERLLGQLKEYTKHLTISNETPELSSGETGRTGMFDGEFSIVFAYLLLYEIGKEEEYLELAKQHTKKILPLIQKDKNFDLLAGNAGAILVLLKLYDITKDGVYLRIAAAAGDILCSGAVKMESGVGWACSGKTPLCGMAHGNSGILTALARLYGETKETKFYDACLQCLEYEESRYSKEFQDWKDLRKVAAEYGHEESLEMSWCHGFGGIALSRVLAMEALDGKTGEETEHLRRCLERDIKRAVPKLESHFLRQGMCVCHGTMGNYRIMKKLQGYFDEQTLERVRADVFEQVLCWEKEEPDLLVQEYHSPGFMNGLAGIGYYLLKEIDGGLPDILEM